MNTKDYEYAHMQAPLMGNGKIQGYEFVRTGFPKETFNLPVEICRYDDGTPWDALGLHVGFTIWRHKYRVGLDDSYYGWRPIPAEHQPKPPIEYYTLTINDTPYQFEKDTTFEWQQAIQMEILTTLRAILAHLKDNQHRL